MRTKNIYSCEFKRSGRYELQSVWILAATFAAAQKKAQKWATVERRNSGDKIEIRKVEFEGDIDVF